MIKGGFMKKLVSILLSLVSVICLLLTFGCRLPTIEIFVAGTYEATDIEGEPFSKAKLMIQPIAKEEFDKADGINVIKNESKSKENNIYYSFELFIFDDRQSSYMQTKISDVKFDLGTPSTYYCDIKYEWKEELIKYDLTFIYDISDSANRPYFYRSTNVNGQYEEIEWKFRLIDD